MINEPPPFKCPNIRIPIIISIKGRGRINQGSTLGYRERKQKSKLPFRVQGMEKNMGTILFFGVMIIVICVSSWVSDLGHVPTGFVGIAWLYLVCREIQRYTGTH